MRGIAVVLSAIVALLPISHGSAQTIIRKTDPDVSDTGWTGPNGDLIGGTLSLDNAIARCPKGTFVTGIRVFRIASGYTPMVHLRFLCGNDTNNSVEIGRQIHLYPMI